MLDFVPPRWTWHLVKISNHWPLVGLQNLRGSKPIYRKIPYISPGLIEVRKPFFGGGRTIWWYLVFPNLLDGISVIWFKIHFLIENITVMVFLQRFDYGIRLCSICLYFSLFFIFYVNTTLAHWYWSNSLLLTNRILLNIL